MWASELVCSDSPVLTMESLYKQGVMLLDINVPGSSLLRQMVYTSNISDAYIYQTLPDSNTAVSFEKNPIFFFL